MFIDKSFLSALLLSVESLWSGFFKKKYLFIYLSETERGKKNKQECVGREAERRKEADSALSLETDVGLDPMM